MTARVEAAILLLALASAVPSMAQKNQHPPKNNSSSNRGTTLENGSASTRTFLPNNSARRWKTIPNSAIFRLSGSNNYVTSCSASTMRRRRSKNKC